QTVVYQVSVEIIASRAKFAAGVVVARASRSCVQRDSKAPNRKLTGETPVPLLWLRRQPHCTVSPVVNRLMPRNPLRELCQWPCCAGGRAGFALAKDGTHFLISFHGFAVGSVRCGADSGSGGDHVRQRHTRVLRTDRQMGQQKQAETSRSSEKHTLRMRYAAGRRRER